MLFFSYVIAICESVAVSGDIWCRRDEGEAAARREG